MLTAMSPHHEYLLCEKSMHTTCHSFHQGPRPSWSNCRPRLEDSTPQFWGSGRDPCLGSRPPIGPKHTQLGFMSGLRAGHGPPAHPVMPEKQPSHLLCGAWHCPGHPQIIVEKKKKRPSPMEAYTITEKRDVGSATESSIQHHQFTPPTIVDGNPYHHWGWGATVIVRGWDARINLSVSPLVLLCEGARPSLWNSITRDWSLKTRCLQWPRSHLLHGGVAFDSLQSQSGTPGGTPRPIDRNQKPTMPWTDKRLRNRRIIISTRRQEAEMKRLSLTIQTNCLCAFSGCGQTPSTPTPALMRPKTVSVASQNFADTSLRHTQHCCHF